MVGKTEHRFPKDLRIRRRSEYLEIQDKGVKVHGRGFLGLLVRRPDDRAARLGITTTRRLGTAVVRNRTRRLVREAFRRGLMALPAGLDMVIVAKKPAAEMAAAAIFEDLIGIARKAARALEVRG
jgi:ribonuclease P protein component